MQLSQLFANVLSNPRQLKTESKEQFFNTKHRPRRMKKSTCFSEQIEKDTQQFHPLDTTLASTRTQEPFQGCCKELESTFGEENVLAFKAKPPKRKRNLRNHPCQKKEESSQSSDSEASPQNSLVFHRKTSETFKSSFELLKKQTSVSTLSIADFHILGKIGEGSYSQVYRAVEKSTGFLCALKVLEKWKMREMAVQENVAREIKINMFLEHPNIAKLYGCFHDQDHIYLICEYGTDKSLYELIKEPKHRTGTELSYEKVTRLVGQICQAVRYIHRHSIIHRDIKPENILLTMHNTIKICDFGWSVYNPGRELRLTLCGTPLYLAPEMISQSYYDDSVDIWAIGVLTYQLLTEESPFKITQMRDLSKILHQEINLAAIPDPHAADFIKQTLEKDPNKRRSIFELCRHPFIANFFN